MRIRDISQAGFYARPATTSASGRLPARKNHELKFHAVHVISVAPMFITELTQFVLIPITETEDGGFEVIDPDVLFDDDDGWRFLCDGSEPDFGPHTFLMKLIQLSGYSEDDARRIACDTLVESLDRQIYGAAQTHASATLDNLR